MITALNGYMVRESRSLCHGALLYYYTVSGRGSVVRIIIIITVPGESMSFVHWNRDHPVSQLGCL